MPCRLDRSDDIRHLSVCEILKFRKPELKQANLKIDQASLSRLYFSRANCYIILIIRPYVSVGALRAIIKLLNIYTHYESLSFNLFSRLMSYWIFSLLFMCYIM